MFNEMSINCLFYMIVLFSKFNTNKDTYYYYGLGYLSIIGLILFVNIGLLVTKSVKSIKQKLKLKWLIKARDARNAKLLKEKEKNEPAISDLVIESLSSEEEEVTPAKLKKKLRAQKNKVKAKKLDTIREENS